jgi:hypothetical protein
MRSSHVVLGQVEIAFDDEHAVGGAGLLLVAARPRARRLAATLAMRRALGADPVLGPVTPRRSRLADAVERWAGGGGAHSPVGVLAASPWPVMAALPGRRLLAPLRSRCALASARVEPRNGEAAAGHRRPAEKVGARPARLMTGLRQA